MRSVGLGEASRMRPHSHGAGTARPPTAGMETRITTPRRLPSRIMELRHEGSFGGAVRGLWILCPPPLSHTIAHPCHLWGDRREVLVRRVRGAPGVEMPAGRGNGNSSSRGASSRIAVWSDTVPRLDPAWGGGE